MPTCFGQVYPYFYLKNIQYIDSYYKPDIKPWNTG